MTEPFKFSDGQLAYTAEELCAFCEQSPDESFEYLMKEDFEKWLNYINKSDLAAKAGQIRQASISDGDRIKEFIVQCQAAPVVSPEPSPKESSPKTPEVAQPIVAAESTKTPKASPLGNFFKNLFGKKQVASNQK